MRHIANNASRKLTAKSATPPANALPVRPTVARAFNAVKHRRKSKFSSQNTGTQADHGPTERWQHSGKTLTLTLSEGHITAKALEENALDILCLAKVISEKEKESGLKLNADFHAAGMASRVGSSYNPVRVNGPVYGAWDDRTEAEERAYKRWREALKAIPLALRNGVAMTTCYEQIPPSQFFPDLRKGLAALSDHYEHLKNSGTTTENESGPT